MNLKNQAVAEHDRRPVYRPDIDGIRAVAIFTVVAFHAFPSRFPGGYVGVDVFFVLSGYLISTIIYKGLAKSDFSFLDFYAHRARRIFPALIFVMVAVLAFGWFVLFPEEFSQLGKHVAAGAGFAQNFVLWGEAGYFDVSSDLKPLMHLWSLAIEEQFYLIFPAVIWLAWRFRLNLLAVIATVFLLSFADNMYEIHLDPIKAFFFPQTRCWQLMAGAALGWFTFFTRGSFPSEAQTRNKFFCSILSLLGFGLICASVFGLSNNTLYPNWLALAPVSGAVLLIFVGEQAYVNRVLLSNRVAVWLGLISYPLYLWHWPLLSLARILASRALGNWPRIGIVALSVVFAMMTNLWVEKPMRYGNPGFGRKEGLLTLLLFTIGLGGYVCFIQDGFRSRAYSKDELSHFDQVTSSLDRERKYCRDFFPHWNDLNDNICFFQKDIAPSVLLIGDSHAGQLYPGLRQLFRNDESVGVLPASCAAPFIDVATGTSEPANHIMRKENYGLINSAIEYAIHNKSVQVVVLAHNPHCSLGDAIDMENPSDVDGRNILRRGLKRTLSRLLNGGKKVIVLLDNPEIDFDPASCKRHFFKLSTSADLNCYFPRSELDNDVVESTYSKLVKEVVKEYPTVQVFDVGKQLCDDLQCSLARNGKLLYEDRSHLNIFGSEYVAKPLFEMISESLHH